MAGYIMTMDGYQSILTAAEQGVYSTKITEPGRLWGAHHEGTLADYVTMTAGDDLFFFHDRRIYGIGRLVEVHGACRYLNFPNANIPRPLAAMGAGGPILIDKGAETGRQRWLCLFRPSPHFFDVGVDMDEALESNPSAFRMLRVMQRVSFKKLSDPESAALRNIILRRNEENIPVAAGHHMPFDLANHTRLAGLITREHHLGTQAILAYADDGRGGMGHEMAIECRLLDQLHSGDGNARAVFGQWSYLTHQVAASPFKPIHYMDKIDVFGYRYIDPYDAISKYLVCEIKRISAEQEDIDQLMKYVDWVSGEYCNGDYSQVEAFLVARDIPGPCKDHATAVARRQYTIGSHPTRSMEWSAVKLVSYEYAHEDLEFTCEWPAV